MSRNGNREPPDHDPLIALPDNVETDEVHHPYSAWLQGYSAAEQEIPSSLNPYPEDSPCNWWWEDGYETFLEQQTDVDPID